MNQFPDLKVYGVEVLKDFVATYNAQKYKTENELLIKFPEFFNDDNEQKFKENIKDISDNEHALQSNNGLIGKLEILAFILYLILYPIRLIFYLIIWSFKTLNDHD